jgi:hypothetical protein
MLHVAGVVGGVASQQKNGGQPGVLFTTIPAPRQRKAVDFLNAQVFATPSFLVDPTVLRRIEPDGVLARLRNAQATVLEGLLTSTRIQRMSEQEAIDGEKAYKPLDLLGDVRRGIFTELAAPAPKIDPYRRNLQQTYLEAMHMRINGGAAPSTHRWLYRGELKSLSADRADRPDSRPQVRPAGPVRPLPRRSPGPRIPQPRSLLARVNHHARWDHVTIGYFPP